MACKCGLNHLGLAKHGMASCPRGQSRTGEEEGEEEEGNTEVEENKVRGRVLQPRCWFQLFHQVGKERTYSPRKTGSVIF